ncbi:MAG: 5-nucleotidase [Paenibacillaceae bacterium]|jgi:2',3'-cyclic-nucleotide 2'-phosphodiesterase (5'-nucleotidase family)/predicted extracellular nuclease|nr:5-nucleotidase [Paenibacillaceae bacterium]
MISVRAKRLISFCLALLLVCGTILPWSITPAAHATAYANDLFFSEYLEGSSNNKAIEIYNGTDHTVDLADYSVELYFNGNTTPQNTLALSGSLPSGEVYVLVHASANAAIKAQADMENTDVNFNGDDALLLKKGAVIVDSFGRVGQDPGTEWTSSGVSTLNMTLVRKSSITSGDTNPNDAFDPSVEWVAYAQDTIDYLGSHTMDGYGAPNSGDAVAPVTAQPAPGAVAAGTTVRLSTATVSASVYYSVYAADGAVLIPLQPYEDSSPVEITENSTIKAYASLAGKTDSPLAVFDYTILDTNIPPKTDIATARAAADGANVHTEGVVTHISGDKMYIQDGTGAIVLYRFPAFAQIGDRVEVSGAMSYYNNLQEIVQKTGVTSYSVVVENEGAPAPAAIVAADLGTGAGESHEAELVYMENVTIVDVNKSTVTARQGDNETFIIYSSLPGLQSGKTFERIIGVVEQYQTNYQLIPLDENALIEVMLSVKAAPGAGPIIAGQPVKLFSPADNAAIYYTTDGTEPAASSTLYTGPITVATDTTIKAIAVSGGETSRIYTFVYIAFAGEIRIHDIQGKGHTSIFAGQRVEEIEGIVTQYGYNFNDGSYKGFFMEDPNPDNDNGTSEGIYVYTTDSSRKPAVGDLVHVSGTVNEYNENDANNLTSTQITMNTITIVSSNQPLPEPVLLGKGGRAIPASVIDNDGLASFDPEEDGADFYESMEGMRVRLKTPVILSPYWMSGGTVYNIPTRVDNVAPDRITPAGGLVLQQEGNLNPQRLLVAYGNPGQEVSTGDQFAQDIIGVIGYNYANYKVIPAYGALPAIQPNTFEREISTIAVDPEKLLIASYNIENFHQGDSAAKIDKLADSIVNNLETPDIIGLVEVQDNNGETNNGVVEADANGQVLINAIAAKGGPQYVYTDIDPENNQDGGAPGGNIRVAFLYNSDRVELAASINGQKGNATTAVAYNADQDQLTYNPGRIDPQNGAFASSRKPLAAQFVFNEQNIIVIANHFNSKSGDNSPFGRIQPPVLSSEVQRHEIAEVVNSFVKDVLTANSEARIVALGDFNDFQFTETIRLLKGDELTDLLDKLPVHERYTYTYDGNSQALDHILVSKNIASASEVDVVHLNADFSPAKGRVSDHDAVLAQIDLAQTGEFPLTILHTNDTHANLDTTNAPDNILRRVTAIREAKDTSTNPILLDAGDVFSGTLYFNKYEGLADLEFMNMAGYDAMTFGNHEFDKGSQVLDNFIKEARFPFVSSNVDFSKDALLSERFHDGIGEPGEPGNIYPALVREVNGGKVGLIGLTTEDTANISSPGDVTFDDAAEKAKQTVALLQKQGINKIIALSHLGYEADMELAEQVEGIDIIVGGHTHTKLDEAVVDTSHSAPKLIVQTGEKGQFLGKLSVAFNEEGVLTQWDEDLISIDAKNANGSYVIVEDKTARNIFNTKYKPGITELKQQVVGQSEVELNGVRADVRTRETNLGNLIADGMLAAAQEAGTGAVMALQNGGGIRASMPAGPITQGGVLEVLPFNNDLVTITLTGQEIWEALENGVSMLPNQDGRFPHVSGMRFYYDSTKPASQRVVRVEVKQAGRYTPLDRKASYEVATNVFTAKGGDFYASLQRAYEGGKVNLLYLPDYQVFTGYLQKLGTVTAANAAVEGRIVDLKGVPDSSDPGEDSPDNNNPAPVGNGGTPNAPTPIDGGVELKPAAGELKQETASDGTIVTVFAVSPASLAKAFETAGADAKVVISLSEVSGAVKVELPAAGLQGETGRLLHIQTADKTYELPLAALRLESLAASLGAAMDDIAITVSIGMVSGADKKAVEAAASQAGVTLVSDVVSYSIIAEAGDKSVEINDFGSVYVNRTLTLSESLEAAEATAVTMDTNTGELDFVPSVFETADGKTTVTIKRNSNSVYAVVKSALSFGDLSGHWAQKDVELLASKLVVNGQAADRYAPEARITRGEFAALLTRALGLKQDAAEAAGIKDVAAGAWYAGVIGAAVKAGLMEGFEDGTFRPESQITRAEMAVMVSRALGVAGKSAGAGSTGAFADEGQIPSWAAGAVAKSTAAGIIQGTSGNRFAPSQPATRAEAAVMLKRLLQFADFING